MEYLPDARQYKQQSTKVVPMIDGAFPEAEIELPVEMLANAEAYLLAGVEGTKLPKPYLTPKAWKYLVDEWEKVFSDVSPDDFKPKEEVWEEPEPELFGTGETLTEQEPWDDVTTTEEPIPWNEKDEDWGSEPNFDN